MSPANLAEPYKTTYTTKKVTKYLQQSCFLSSATARDRQNVLKGGIQNETYVFDIGVSNRPNLLPQIVKQDRFTT